jgi:hypothetical protein
LTEKRNLGRILRLLEANPEGRGPVLNHIRHGLYEGEEVTVFDVKQALLEDPELVPLIDQMIHHSNTRFIVFDYRGLNEFEGYMVGVPASRARALKHIDCHVLAVLSPGLEKHLGKHRLSDFVVIDASEIEIFELAA